MSRIAPDLPELQQVPEVLRSIVYMRALTAAIRAPLTWLIGGILVALGVTAGARFGSTLLGAIGLVVGAAVGTVVSVACFFKLVLPWQARRALPSAIEQTGGKV